MKRISAVIVVKNEEVNIERCLRSVSWMDEIVIVDNASTDSTVEKCKCYTKNVYFHDSPFTGIKVNFGIQRASSEWVFNIDADEEMSCQLKDEVIAVITNNSVRFNGYRIPVRNLFMGKWLKYGGWYPCYIKRLYRREKARYNAVDHHVQADVEGEVGCLNNHILHYAPNDVSTYLRKMNLYTTNSIREHGLQKKKNWFNILLKPPLIFIKRYIILEGFLDGLPGFVSAFYILIDNLKVVEIHYYAKEHR